MATLELIDYEPRRPSVLNGRVDWTLGPGSRIERLPQILWKDGSTWGEANLWALRQATSLKKDLKTVRSAMSHLHAYAKWLESEALEWWHFPVRESERCLNRFRGALVRARGDGLLSPTTASQRMAAVVRFYRWGVATRLLSPEWPMWSERYIGIRLVDSFGMEHTLRVTSTDLAIPNRKVAGAIHLEDGVLPVSQHDMTRIVEVADLDASAELALMLRLGFQCGMRIGTILDLRLQTLQNATADAMSGWHRIAVGPSARPPVATKFGVSGRVPIPGSLLDRVMEYATSTRRLKRQALASPSERNLLFLTRFGRSYARDDSRAVNVEMSRLRKAGVANGVDIFREFNFHRSRATFATILMGVALKYLPVGEAVQFVREACLHRNDATTLQYVKFIEKNKAMADAADAFTEAFMGLFQGDRRA